ncbi:MAG: hypothetical protein ACI9MC_002398 [Kiritimatiellia bacterium]|jgi:hypothetical protein
MPNWTQRRAMPCKHTDVTRPRRTGIGGVGMFEAHRQQTPNVPTGPLSLGFRRTLHTQMGAWYRAQSGFSDVFTAPRALRVGASRVMR